MTLEEMETYAEKIVAALKAQGLEAEYMKDETVPGDPLPLMVEIDGEAFTLGLMPA